MDYKAILKSIGALVAGFLTVALLSTGTDALLQWLGWYPVGGMNAPIMLILALVYRSIYTVAGGYVVAWLAPDKPMKHVVILAYIGVALSVVGVIAGWSLGNQWYPILLALTAYPLVVWGGRLELKRA